MCTVILSILLGALAGAVAARVMMEIHLVEMDKINKYYQNKLVDIVVKTVSKSTH